MSKPKTTPAPVEVPQIETDVENLKKQVAFLESKAKSQNEQINLMASYCKSCEGLITSLHGKIKKIAETNGIDFQR